MDQLPRPEAHGHFPSGLSNINLQQLAAGLNQGKWFICGCILLMVAGGFVYTQLAAPVYQSSALIQVSDTTPADRTDNTSDLLLNYRTSSIATEIAIVTSQPVLAEAAKQLSLDIDVTPNYFPILGEATARFAANSGYSFSPPIGGKHYVWGDEHVQIERLSVPASDLGRILRLVVGQHGRYYLYGPDGKVLLAGHVGSVATVRTPQAPGQPVEAVVSEIKAHPGAEFFITQQPKAAIIDKLQNQLQVSEVATGRQPTGIMQLTLKGPDPQQLAGTLNTVVKAYIRQNIERKQEETAKILAFLNKQLPVVKASLDKAETALSSYNAAHGGLDIPVETSSLTTQIQDVEKEMLATRIQLIELEQNFGDRHPAVITVKNKLQQLEARKNTLTNQASTLPGSSQTVARLTRNVKVDTDLYMRLLNKAQELNTAKAGIIGNLHLIEQAMPSYDPINMPPRVILLFNAIAGLLLGSSIVIGRRLLANKLENLPALEHALGLPIYANIPHSENQYQMSVNALIQGEKHLPVLALQEQDDRAIAQLRRLRTKLFHAMAGCKNNLILICSPTQSNGKSFVSVNLAYLCAFAERRVLLIDADLRRGGASAYFSRGKVAGLADVLGESASLQGTIQATDTPNLSFLPAGTLTINSADLLTSANLKQVLADVSKQYDLVILDMPPVLAATDAVIVAPMAGLNLIVAHAGRSKVQLIEQAIGELGKHGADKLGVVINDARPESEELGYAY